jgi:hypothetical protein
MEQMAYLYWVWAESVWYADDDRLLASEPATIEQVIEVVGESAIASGDDCDPDAHLSYPTLYL